MKPSRAKRVRHAETLTEKYRARVHRRVVCCGRLLRIVLMAIRAGTIRVSGRSEEW